MREMELCGVTRGKTVKTTQAPRDLVKRQFSVERPNQLWGADFTFVST